MWMRIDDGLHAHRKTRAVTKGHETKSRDSAPMGLWVLAGSWSARNNRDGWVPEEELDRFDDDWQALTKRLVHAGYWWPEQRDGEDGYGFNDWQEWNNPDGASASGSFGNHVRWHVNKGVVKPGCEHCPAEPDDRGESGASRPDDRPDIAPESGGESGLDLDSKAHVTGKPLTHDVSAGQIGFDRPDIGCESLRDHRPDSLTQPIPTPIPNPDPEPPSRKRSETEPSNRFDEFWETYSHKLGRKKAETAYRAALKKPGVTEAMLIATAAAYITWQMNEGKHPQFTKHAATWLHGEHWRDERKSVQAPAPSNVQRHLQLAQQLAERESGPQPPQPRQIGTSR